MAQAAHARDIDLGYGGIRSFLPHSIAATLAVLAFPSAVLFSTLLLTEPNPPILLCSMLSIALSSLASVVGARLWQKHPKSKDISFGDLMIWSWWTHRRAETRLQRGTAALGLDRRGTPIGELSLSRDAQLRILHELNEALESKDPYTRGHSRRVERHVFRMANSMGLSVHEIEDLRLAAVLHDVGKIRVPDHILRKPGKLTPDEYRLMQDHSSVGAWMLSYVGNQDVIEAVRYHHERWDGFGYPDGVAGTDIPLFARMIAVADTFDAITSTRPYRARAARDFGVEELNKVSGSQLDPMCVEVFVSSLPAPVPVAAAVLYLLPMGIKKLARELGVVSRRAGLSTIASGVGAASAAVIVTTPVVAPSLAPRPASIERTVESSTGERGSVAPDDAELVADNEVEAVPEQERKEEGRNAPTDGGLKSARARAGVEEPLTSTAPQEIDQTDATDGASDSGTSTDPDDGDSGNAGDGSGNSGSSNEGSGSGTGVTEGKEGKDDKSGPGGNGTSGSGGNGTSGSGNPGASAGHGAPDNSGSGKDKDHDDKGKDKGEGEATDGGGGGPSGEAPADPGPGNSGNGNGGGNENGNGNGGGNENGNGGGSSDSAGPPAPGSGGNNGTGNGSDGKDKEKDKGPDPAEQGGGDS